MLEIIIATLAMIRYNNEKAHGGAIMNTFIKFLNAEIKICESIVKFSEKKISKLPEGRLRVSMKKGKPYFYHCQKNHSGKYLKAVDFPLCVKLANREKYEELIKRCKSFLECAYPLRERFVSNNWRDFATALHPSKMQLYDNDIVSDDDYEVAWLDELPLSTYDEKHKIPTKRGDFVRSKSEKEIADILYDLGIPYRYEAKIFLDGNEKFPDFTILDKVNRKEIYWEHFGILDMEDYAANSIYKIDEYSRFGYHLYEDLIISCETKFFQFPFEFLREYLKNRFCA